MYLWPRDVLFFVIGLLFGIAVQFLFFYSGACFG